MPSPPSPRPASPASSLIAQLRLELMRGLPFSRMRADHVDRFISLAQQAYFAPGEVLLEPSLGPVRALHLIRQGRVSGTRTLQGSEAAVEYVGGDLFPVGAVLGERAVTARYVAHDDTFCLLLPAAAVHELAALSAPFAEFLQHRITQFLDASRQALQAHYAAQALAEQSLDARLETLTRKALLAMPPQTPLADALAAMQARHVGSVIATDAAGAPCGILTRHDIVGRVTLPQLPLSTPLAAVMSTPVHTLRIDNTLQDAALLMSRHGVRHVPITHDGTLVNIVSERDLFALQRLSLKQLSTQLRAAPDVATLKHLAAQIRQLARSLLGQGVQARQLTELISHLNDALTLRLVQLVAEARGMNLDHACWLAFGSEGRGEQTIATDQDNGLIFVSDDPQRDRPAWLAFGRDVNDALDACGYPLCKGNVMASNPQCCLTAAEWRQRFADWVAQGAPQDLLNASIYFDLRALAGNLALAQPLREMLGTPQPPRFIKQLAENALQRRAPLNWRGAIDTQDSVDGHPMFDLKLQGSALFVDMARVYSLAHGVAAIGTRERLTALQAQLQVAPQEGQAWVSAFEFLQMLRLRIQVGSGEVEAPALNPNLIDVSTLNDIDLRMLKETCKVARALQQRLELDYRR